MIISSRHHDLIEEFQKANEDEGRALKALSSYMKNSSSGSGDEKQKQLFKQFEEAHERYMKLHGDLKKLDLSQTT